MRKLQIEKKLLLNKSSAVEIGAEVCLHLEVVDLQDAAEIRGVVG